MITSLHISTGTMWRGGERQTHFLMQGLVDRGQVVKLICPHAPLADKVEAYGQVYRLRNIAQMVRSTALLCKTMGIEIIHAHDSRAHTVMWLAMTLMGVDTPGIATKRLATHIHRASRLKYNHHRIKRIICISEAVRSTLAPAVTDQSRLSVIHSGVPLVAQVSPRSIASRPLRLGYVAAFAPEKNHRLIPRLLQALDDGGVTAYELHLYGDGPERRKMQQELARNKGVTIHGHVDDITQIYSGIDILVHLSKEEALGTAILDGMKFAVPTVAFDVGGISEIVSNGANGFLHQYGDVAAMASSIFLMQNQPELYQKLSQQCLLDIKHYSLEQMVSKTLTIYNKALEE